MNNNDFEKLILELEETGASKKEAEELSLLSKNISNLFNVKRSAAIKGVFLATVLTREKVINTSVRKWLAIPLLSILLVVILGSTVASAQKSLPGQPLYPVKILSENAAIAISPRFKGEVLQRRSEEIKALSNRNNSQNSDNLHKTIKTYEKTLQEDGGINIESFEKSKKNLEEASKSANLENIIDIENVIKQTDIKREDIQRESENNDLNSKRPSFHEEGKN
jgi:hypothetical protein